MYQLQGTTDGATDAGVVLILNHRQFLSLLEGCRCARCHHGNCPTAPV
jgi:hypothetical protein